jgi:hypothetical protein
MTQVYIISLKESAPPSTRKTKQADKKLAKFVEGEVRYYMQCVTSACPASFVSFHNQVVGTGAGPATVSYCKNDLVHFLL